MNLKTKFTLPMTLALLVVMTIAGFLLVRTVTAVARQATEERLVEAVELTASVRAQGSYELRGTTGMRIGQSSVTSYPVTIEGPDGHTEARVLRAEKYEGGDLVNLLVPDDSGKADRGLLGFIIGIIALVLLVAFVVSVVIAGQVAAPIEGLVDDVRAIAGGNLAHRTHVRGAREVQLLGKTIDRMAASLREAQDAELELMARERELAVAGEVREALLPENVPQVDGYELGALQIPAPEPGGDFYDVIERGDGKLGLLQCEVSGRGVPGALVAATARSYLRAVLAGGGDPKEALCRVNRFFAPDVRRGMYVTAMYVELDPAAHVAVVACAGHKVPLLRFSAADKSLRKVQPEGIALGFDKGPIFERTLETVRLELGVGDRLVLSNQGPLMVQNPQGEELGDQGFFRGVLKRATYATEELLENLDIAFETFADGEDYPADISLLTLRRTR
ncbi:MAG: SpoIIE family protein phosphatase [Planctomycetes bacterium]|nr:SpoIIE family protein phosphatase [Planctomycetota bacterium]